MARKYEVKFKCDTCGKVKVQDNDNRRDDGWFYIAEVRIVGFVSGTNLVDMDYCSEACLRQAIDSEIKSCNNVPNELPEEMLFSQPDDDFVIRGEPIDDNFMDYIGNDIPKEPSPMKKEDVIQEQINNLQGINSKEIPPAPQKSEVKKKRGFLGFGRKNKKDN